MQLSRVGHDPARGLNPAIWLAYWALAVVGVQRLSGFALLLALCLLFGVALGSPGNALAKLLKRSRFLFIALFVLFAFFSPGTALLRDLPSLSPTLEGLELAAIHLGRLMCVIALVAILLARMKPSRLVGGMVTLLGPLRIVGLSPERLAVRLSLVLELSQVPADGGWRAWLQPTGALLMPSVQLDQKPLRAGDLLWVVPLFILCWWIL